MKKFFQSLLAKYMLIIFMAIFLTQIGYIVIAIIVTEMTKLEESSEYEYQTIEENWHEEARQIENPTKETIEQHFHKWKRAYNEAGMFWVNGEGELEVSLNVNDKIPKVWNFASTAKFIKERYDNDPFTVIAFVGDGKDGFVVIEIPREAFLPASQKVFQQYGNIFLIGMIVIIILFIFVSFLFFRSIRKRLVHLQESMTTRDSDGLPLQTKVKKKDEIGQLEETFNEMVYELRESKRKEREEEQLRRELIANLSHDLRTPLTKIRSQTYSLGKETLSDRGKKTVKGIEASIVDMDRLIDNLMSYTLLMASKYKQERKEIDIIRHVRECLATWYPVFEKEGFEMDVRLSPFKDKYWVVDPIWVSRIIDNLLQNVLRHAKAGKYVGIYTESTEKFDAIVIRDKGKGMDCESSEKGVGIGLSIVDMMVRGMDLEWEIKSSEQGTIIKMIKRNEGP